MRCSTAAVLASAIHVVTAAWHRNVEDKQYTIKSANIKANFITYGASVTNLWVKDKRGNDIDIVLGYDDINYYRKATPP